MVVYVYVRACVCVCGGVGGVGDEDMGAVWERGAARKGIG